MAQFLPDGVASLDAVREANAAMDRLAKVQHRHHGNIDDKMLGISRRHHEDRPRHGRYTAQQVRSYKPDDTRFESGP